jgi:murein DD-endopeptidase MepM/ murein hydrolase activator NlpD
MTTLKFMLKSKHRQKIINLCYCSAVLAAFIFSLAHNNRVEASVDSRDYFSYLTIEDEDNTQADSEGDVISGEAAQNIRAMFNMVDNLVRQQNVDKDITLQSGDTLISALGKLGISRADANGIYYSLKEHYNPQSLRAGQHLKINITTDTKTGETLAFNYLIIEPTVGEKITTIANNDSFETMVEKDEYIDEITSTTGVIDGNLTASMNRKGVPMRIISNFVNLFTYGVDFKRDIKKGDRFEIVFESTITPTGRLVKSGNILYAGLVLRQKKVALYRFEDAKGKAEYFTEKGQALKKTLQRKPMAFQAARISSPFGKRFHPILKKYKIHWGVDYAAPKGSAVYAGGDGVVLEARYNGSYGNYIKIRHNNSLSTAYGHMSGFAKGIRAGSRVTQGQPIGYVGSTGRSTGPHLHYEVIQNGRRVNPCTIKASTGENLSGSALTAFKKQVAKIEKDYGRAFAENQSTKLAQK